MHTVMKKISFLPLFALLLFSFTAIGQGKFYTKSGKITFFSSTSMEDIEASNRSVTALLDTKTGDMQFAVLMKGFEFKKALMQEHFNRDYIESDKYPKAEFKGQVVNNADVNYSVDGNYTATVKGKLTIHGQTRDIETTGTITSKDGKLVLKSVFNLLIADYNIKVARIHKDNISNSIRVTVDCTLSPLQ